MPLTGAPQPPAGKTVPPKRSQRHDVRHHESDVIAVTVGPAATVPAPASPRSATLAAAVNAINTETGAAQGNFLSTLAASTANQTQVGLIGLATTGLEFGGPG